DLADFHIETENTKSYAAFRPLGPVLAVMPWNFPFWQVLRFAAPAIAAGNVGLLKHASNIPGCALALEELFRDAGAPDGVFQTLMIRADAVAAVIEHPDIAAVTITGSTPAGRNVASTAGDNLKKSVLELGGSDPYVVLEDADLEKTVESCIASRLMNTGQTCIAAKRLIVVEDVLDEFTERLVGEMKKKTYGDPMDESIDLGPMARADLRDELHDQVLRSIDGGAECLLGGESPNIKGAFYPPTVLGNVKIGTPAFEEELFGPVACIVPAADEGEAVRLANDSPFGLGAAVFTKDEARGERIARDELQAGSCFVNDFVKSDPRLPFGGVKESGYGRELSSFGLRE
ncbi:MAG: aldehyde dehydrogenase family protein, partial [Alphaproteobacteria bacterium]|nr:aldehyde dehydrogenase family protein [Alphaproteobacteria bacterium]